MIYFILFIVLWGSLLIYFEIADRYNIIDHPNERSSHSTITIRGGGVVFLLAMILATALHTSYLMVGIGAVVIGVISFIDDRITLSSKLRMIFHILAVSLMFMFLHAFKLPTYHYLFLYVLAIGIINAHNFMDGINGITGAYSLVVLGGLQWVNFSFVSFIKADLIWLPIIASIIFLVYNFRIKAKCFAGDVGSVTLAFWLVFLLLKLILLTSNWTYLLFLAVYGVDAVLTILHRLILKQNIFEAHRLHFYQLLANECKVPHLIVAAAYALLQLVIMVLVVLNAKISSPVMFAIILAPLCLAYLAIKPRFMKLRKQ